MANTDFGILLKTMLDKSGINTELEQVQKIVNKYSVAIMPELQASQLRHQMKTISQDIANEVNKALGTKLTSNDVFKAFENQAKQAEKAIKDQAKAIEKARQEQEKYIAKVRESSAQAQSDKANARIKEANSLLSQQKNAYQEIWNINKQLSSLDPEKDSNQISSLNDKKKIYQDIYLSTQKQLRGYGDIISNEERMKALAEIRKKIETEIAIIQGKLTDSDVARVAKESAQAEKERLAALEKQRIAQANIAKEKAKTNSQQELAQQKEINAILSKQESAYKEIWNINKQISTLDPTKNSDQISALNEKKKFYQEIYLSAQKELQAYNNIAVNQEHLASLAEIRKKAESEIGVAVAKQNEALAKAQAENVNRIQLSMSTGGYESKVDSLIGKTQQWVDANGNARISTDALQTAMNNLNTAYANITATGGNTVANQKALIEAERALDTEVKKVQSSVTSMNATMAKSTAVDSLRQKVQMFYDTNTKSHRTYGAQLRAIVSELATGAEVPITRLRQIQQEFIGIQNSARQAGKLGLSFFDTLKQGMQKFSYWTSSTFLVMKAIQSIKSAVSTVKELDTALVDLKKTTTMTAKELEDFYYASNETAKKMGVTTQSIIEQASAWSRLGYSSQEAATKMAEYSSMFATISPGMDLDSATDGLVSVMKAFKIGAEDVDDVVDGIMSKINIIGNTQALNNSDIVDFLTRSSSAMAEANNSLEETIALGTAATEITRDAASVGNMLKTVSMRIRGYDEETESYSEELENLSGTIADLTKTASTPGGVSLFTDASKTTYKSTYQILKDISEIYDELDDKTQAELLEALAGKRQGQAVAAIINNFENAEKSMESMANSAGNAEAEMAVAIDSIAYKTNTLSEIGTGISQNLFGREDMKMVLDTINSLGEGIQWLTDKLGLFGSISLGAGLFAGFKNVGTVQLY